MVGVNTLGIRGIFSLCGIVAIVNRRVSSYVVGVHMLG